MSEPNNTQPQNSEPTAISEIRERSRLSYAHPDRKQQAVKDVAVLLGEVDRLKSIVFKMCDLWPESLGIPIEVFE